MTNLRCELCGNLGGTYRGGGLEWENGEMIRPICIDKQACKERRNPMEKLNPNTNKTALFVLAVIVFAACVVAGHLSA